MAKISVIIPAYNHAKELKTSLKSLFAQTFDDFEVIAVNDGSTDETEDILRLFLGRIKIINTENRGAPAARNLGARQASGQLLFFMDADVALRRECLETMLNGLQNHQECAFAYSSFKFGWKKFKGQLWDFEALKKKNFIHTASLLRREAFPGFDETLKKFQDWDLWLEIAKRGGRGLWIPEVLFRVVPRKSGMSKWLPKFAYKLPWLKAVKEYKQAAEIIKKKHNLC